MCVDFSWRKRSIYSKQGGCFRLTGSQLPVFCNGAVQWSAQTLLLRQFLSVCCCYRGSKRWGGRVRVSISSKDDVIISADHTKNHLQPPKKVPGLTVCVKAQQRDCIRGNKHEKSWDYFRPAGSLISQCLPHLTFKGAVHTWLHDPSYEGML